MATDGRKLFIYGVDQNLQNVELRVNIVSLVLTVEWFSITAIFKFKGGN